MPIPTTHEMPDTILSLVPPTTAIENVAPQNVRNKNGLIAIIQRSTSILDNMTLGYSVMLAPKASSVNTMRQRNTKKYF